MMAVTAKTNPFLSQIKQAVHQSPQPTEHVHVIRKWAANANGRIPKLALVLPTVGCRWARFTGGCSVCNFNTMVAENPFSASRFLSQFKQAWASSKITDREFVVDLYTRGSFLDPNELPRHVQKAVLQTLAQEERLVRILLETRPEFVDDRVLREIRDWVGGKTVLISIGLETSNDLVRYYCLNKGFTFEDFKEAATLIKQYFELGVYLLVKPPFLNEREAINDAAQSIRDSIAAGVDRVSLIPTNVQRQTIIEMLWRNGRYRPPWLWTVSHILSEGQGNVSIGGFHFDPAPLERAHNCGVCDSHVVAQLVNGTSITDSCECIGAWKACVSSQDIPLSERIRQEYAWLSEKTRIPDKYLHSSILDLEDDMDSLDSLSKTL